MPDPNDVEMIRPVKWCILIFLLIDMRTNSSERKLLPRIVIPALSHTALSGDLTVYILDFPQMQNDKVNVSIVNNSTGINEDIKKDSENPFLLRILRLDGLTSEFIGDVPITQLPLTTNISLKIPCGLLTRGGKYAIVLKRKLDDFPDELESTEILHSVHLTFEVRWPTPSLSLDPPYFSTYPNTPVVAKMEFSNITCSPSNNVTITKYNLELIFCGVSIVSCDPRKKSYKQVLYSEEINEFPVHKTIKLNCAFFGLVGHYALRLKPSASDSSAPTTSAYIKVDWSNEFKFDVRARSVYPCDSGSGGISVLFEYPSCRQAGDRVRVYGRLRADVASLAPPSTIHYVSELKAPSGIHSLTFDCDIFTERFVEYCFVYVSQAITGAMAEVKVYCIPTFPLQEGDAGGWGPWSQWTPCSSSCVGGTRNRHRFCDAPPPRYGAKFCQGKAVETESCGGFIQLDTHEAVNSSIWDCHRDRILTSDKPQLSAEGAKCRCGCVLNLSQDKVQSIIAASTQACPGRSFWLIQVNHNFNVRLHFEQTKFLCPGQYVRARDGDSLNADLLVDIAFDKKIPIDGTITSSNQTLLLEFFSDEIAAAGESCVGGFFAHVNMKPKEILNNSTPTRSSMFFGSEILDSAKWTLWLTPAHTIAITFLASMLLTSLILIIQYISKYRKYQIAEDLDNASDKSDYSDPMQRLTKRARAMSTITLLSEVVSLVRVSNRGSPKHSKLRDNPADYDDEFASVETQTEYREGNDDSEATLKPSQSAGNISQNTIISSHTNTSLSNMQSFAESDVTNDCLKSQDLTEVINLIKSSSDEENKFNISTSTSASLSSNVSPSTTSSNTLFLRCGKDSKDRRNRERLLQRPGSDFSLANQDSELEMDYYDYNVVNASAVPGSYLGMDPAFLIWIPPLSSEESEGINETELISVPDKETPSPEKPERSQDKAQDELISEYKTRLNEGLLPIHRLLEESRVRVSEESLSLKTNLKDLQSGDEDEKQESQDGCTETETTDKTSPTKWFCDNDYDRICNNTITNLNLKEKMKSENAFGFSDKYKDDKKHCKSYQEDAGVNIPLKDLAPTIQCSSETHIEKDKSEDSSNKEEKFSLICNLLRDDECELKFVDEDEDEFVDNKLQDQLKE